MYIATRGGRASRCPSGACLLTCLPGLEFEIELKLESERGVQLEEAGERKPGA